MFFNFSQALAELPEDAAVRIANEARPPASYLFAQLLPEIPDFSYTAESGSMTVRTTMAPMVALDSPYPESGMIESESFSEGILKLANRTRLQEVVIRRLQALLRELQLNERPTTPSIQNTALNFVDKMIVQAHLDRTEWLRGQALQTGLINWTMGKKTVNVNYGIPTANIFAQRTGTAAYDGSASQFWTDIRLIRKKLKGDVRAIIAHPDTIDAIRYNPANNLTTIQGGDGNTPVTVRRLNATTQLFQDDVNDTVTLVPYGLEGEVYDLANPGKTLKIPFMNRGLLLAVGNNRTNRLVVGEGSTDTPENTLGFTHVGPTTENGGSPGRWADVRVPENEPYQLEARGASNVLPVIENPELIVVASTTLS